MSNKKMTIADVQKMTNILRTQPMPKQQRTLYFTQRQIDRMKTEGENIDLEKMTINGYPFEIIADPFPEVYKGGDSFVERILKEFENALNYKAPK